MIYVIIGAIALFLIASKKKPETATPESAVTTKPAVQGTGQTIKITVIPPITPIIAEDEFKKQITTNPTQETEPKIIPPGYGGGGKEAPEFSEKNDGGFAIPKAI